MQDSSLQIDRLDLWPTTFFSCTNPEHHLIKEDLVSYFNAVSSDFEYDIESGVAVGIKDNLLESKFDIFKHDNEAVQELKNFCVTATSQALSEINGQLWRFLSDEQKSINIDESWFHITKKGGYHDMHTHSNCSWSGIYYVQQGDQDSLSDRFGGNNRFRSSTRMGYFDYGNRYASDSYEVSPEDGKMILFPPYVPHSATPYWGNKDRVVVAFNIRVGTK